MNYKIITVHYELRTMKSALLCLALCLAACKEAPQSDDILDFIPADARMIVRADLDALLKLAGSQSSHGAITLAPDLDKALRRVLTPDQADVLRRTAALGSVADISHAFLFVEPANGMLVAAAPLKPGAHADAPTLEGIVWVHDSAIDTDSLVSSAAAHPASRNPIAREAANADGIASGILSIPEAMSHPAGDDFDAVAFAVDIADRSISLKARAALGDAWVDPFSRLQPIDISSLRGLPAAPALAVAVGLGPEAVAAIEPMVRPSGLPMRMVCKALFSSIAAGGTFAIEAAPGGNAETIRNLSTDNWIIEALLPAGNNSGLLATLIGSQLGQFEAEPEEGAVRIRNFETDEDTEMSDPWAFIADGDLAAASLYIPYGSETAKAFGLRNGYGSRLTAADSALHASLRVMGSAPYILPAVLQDINSR